MGCGAVVTKGWEGSQNTRQKQVTDPLLPVGRTLERFLLTLECLFFPLSLSPSFIYYLFRLRSLHLYRFFSFLGFIV